MTQEFVPYELAVKLKAIGFDEPCFATWSGETLDMSLQIPSDDYFTKAPTFSQAFRWFREKYGLGHMINGIGYESFIMNIGGVLHIFNAFDFETYEEAELACLERLIEIVESKSE